MTTIKSKIRSYLLWAQMRVAYAMRRCDDCRRRGVESVSLYHPLALCRGCHVMREQKGLK